MDRSESKRDAYENVKNAAECGLLKRYPAGVPDLIRERLDKELAFMKDSEQEQSFEITRRLILEARKSSQLILPRGTLSGSIIYYLNSDSKVDPSTPYYYCPKCGYYKQVKEKIFGIDLPEISCPRCGSMIRGSGAGIPLESVWGLKGNRPVYPEFSVTEDFYPFARRILQELYPDCRIENYGTFAPDHFSKDSFRIVHNGYVILPKEREMTDYPEICSYLENGEPCMIGSMFELEERFIKRVSLISIPALNCALTMQRKTGLYYDEIPKEELADLRYTDLINNGFMSKSFCAIAEVERPRKIKEICSIEAMTHNSYESVKNNKKGDEAFALLDLRNTEEFIRYPVSTREDFYDAMMLEGFSHEISFRYSEAVRIGHVRSGVFLKKYPEIASIQLPDVLERIAKECGYLFPRAHCLSYIMLYLSLSYYLKIDSRAYSTARLSMKQGK